MSQAKLVNVVQVRKIGSPGSLYLLIPKRLVEKLGLREGVEFICYEGGGNLYYVRREASLPSEVELPETLGLEPQAREVAR